MGRHGGAWPEGDFAVTGFVGSVPNQNAGLLVQKLRISRQKGDVTPFDPHGVRGWVVSRCRWRLRGLGVLSDQIRQRAEEGQGQNLNPAPSGSSRTPASVPPERWGLRAAHTAPAQR